MQQDAACKGVVKDATGEPIIGVSVIVKGTTNGAVTDIDGNFSLANVKKGATLRFTYLGYNPQEVVYNGQPLNITLVEDSKALDEVVVTALGIKKDAKKLGYAVSTVSSADLTKTGSSNIAAGLYGKATGVPFQFQYVVCLLFLVTHSHCSCSTVCLSATATPTTATTGEASASSRTVL